MANWVLFSTTAAIPTPVAINLDVVMCVMAGGAPGTVSLDGHLVTGSVEGVMQLIPDHMIYPGD
jgi:hypothetical protein